MLKRHNKLALLSILILVIFMMALTIFSCGKSDQSPVSLIRIYPLYETKNGSPKLPIVIVKQADPYPPGVQQIFSPGDPMIVEIAISQEETKSVTFSKFTFFNKNTKNEVSIKTSDDFGPFAPGQIYLLSYIDTPWTAPEEQGTYELRIYIGNKVIASAIFVVVSPP